MDLKTQLGRRVAELRLRAQLTQAQLAERLGVATETISRLERGVVLPSLETMNDLAAALGVDLSELFSFPERPSPRQAAMESLLSTTRRMTVEQIDAVTAVACILALWKPARASRSGAQGP